MTPAKKRATTIIALRYGIAHAQGVVDDDATEADMRKDTAKSVENMQELHSELTGHRWVC